MSDFERDVTVVMGLGRGMEQTPDGLYVPSDETAARAYAMFEQFAVDPFKSQGTVYVMSGWYGRVASGGKMPEPPAGVSEAALMERVFSGHVRELEIDESPVAGPWVVIENDSVDTFTNLTESCRRVGSRFGNDVLAPGVFNPERPFVFSASRIHAARFAVAATQALALPEDSMFRLPDSGIENSKVHAAQERLLLVVTRMALANVGEVSGAEQGNLQHTLAASQAFAEMAHPDNRVKTLASVAKTVARHPSFARPVGVPVLANAA